MNLKNSTFTFAHAGGCGYLFSGRTIYYSLLLIASNFYVLYSKSAF